MGQPRKAMTPRSLNMPEGMWEDLSTLAEARALDTAAYVRMVLKQHLTLAQSRGELADA